MSKDFLDLHEHFINKFKKQFVQNFKNNTSSDDKSSVELLANLIYDDIISSNLIANDALTQTLFTVLGNNQTVGTQVSKNILYLLENYSSMAINSNNESLIEKACSLGIFISKYIHMLDIAIKLPAKHFYSIDTTIGLLASLKDENKKLTLFNFYKGVLIRSEAEILDIIDDNAVLKVDYIQSQAIFNEDNLVFISADENIKSFISASVAMSDITVGTITIKNVEFLEFPPPATKREHSRLYPSSAINIDMSKNANLISGKIFDISVGGMGILSEDENIFEIDDEIDLDFILRGDSIYQKAKIVAIIKYGDTNRFCLSFVDDGKNDTPIAQYAKTREEEIKAELS